MTGTSGWRPIQKPDRPAGVTLAASPFARLARTHALSAAADGLITVALAGSIFFSIAPNAARWRVALYLVLTIAPFAVVTPLIGPIIDRARGGRRSMILGTAFARALVAFLMAGHMDSLLLFPLAFLVLVLQKAYAVTKSAVVPKLVGSEGRLVEANSKLALLSAIASMGGAGLGAIFSFIGGPALAAGLAIFVYIAAGLAAVQLPRIAVAEQSTSPLERSELRGAGIVLAASAMGVLRGVVGFMTFLLAFELRGGKDGVDIKPLGAAAGASTAIVRKINIVGDPGAPAWHFGAVVAAAGIGALAGARVAPWLRQRVHEENILLSVLGLTAVAGIFAAWTGGLFGAVLLSLAVAIAAGSGKLAFDSLVQRDAPDANYGRSFSRFEAHFQLTWVVGAFIPVVIRLPARVGYVLVTAAAGFAGVSYLVSARAARQAAAHPRTVDLLGAGDDDQRWIADPAGPARRRAPAPDPDATHVLPAPDATRVFDADLPEEPAHPAAAEGWPDVPATPYVSSVDGVEVDPDVGTPPRRVPPPPG